MNKKKTGSLDLSAVKDLLKQNLVSKQIESASCKIALRKLETEGSGDTKKEENLKTRKKKKTRPLDLSAVKDLFQAKPLSSKSSSSGSSSEILSRFQTSVSFTFQFINLLNT